MGPRGGAPFGSSLNVAVSWSWGKIHSPGLPTCLFLWAQKCVKQKKKKKITPDKRQMQFSLTHLIILRHLWEKANYVSVSQATNSYWKSIKGPACLGKNASFNLPVRFQRRGCRRMEAKTSVQKNQSLPQTGMARVERKFCLDSSCQNQNLFQSFFLMWIAGGATTGICIQTGTLQISSNPGDKGMTFMICKCYYTCVNCQNKALGKGNFYLWLMQFVDKKAPTLKRCLI